MTDEQGPPPGWYTDPVDRSGQRYWDGTGWTSQARDNEPAAAMPRQPAEPTTTPPAMHPATAPAVSPPVDADQRPSGPGGPPRAVLAVLGGLVGIALVVGIGYSVDRWLLTDAPSATEPEPVAATDEVNDPTATGLAGDDASDQADVDDTDGSPEPLDPVDVDVDALRPEQFIAGGYTCLDLREAPDLWQRSAADGRVVWSYEEPDPSARPADALWAASRLELLATTDLTGDGRQELVISASCTSGAGGQPQVIAVYAFDGGQPRILDILHEGVAAGLYGDVLRGVQVDVGQISALRATYDEAIDGDAAAVEEIEFRWDPGAGVFATRQVAATQWWARPAVFEVPVFGGQRVGPRDLAATRIIDGFVMPSGNIACVQTGDGSVSCVMRSLLDPQPASSANPDCSRFDLIRLLPSSSARAGCDDDRTVPFAGLPTLEYDRQWSTTDGSIVCSSAETGLECSNGGGHGLFLSRALWDAW